MFIPHTDTERKDMLSTIGRKSMDGLFKDIPEKYRFPALDLPDGISEMEARQQMEFLADANNAGDEMLSFLGAGAYDHYIPAAVDMLVKRGDFFTAYTPYQPEISQGTLQAIFEFQTLIANLTGMEVSNASHYDGATAAAETCISAFYHFRKKRNKFLISSHVHPHYIDTIRTYLQSIEDVEIIVPKTSNVSELSGFIDKNTALVITQYPDFLGNIYDQTNIADSAHKEGALFATAVYPLALGMLKSPAEMGADFIIGEGQSLGLPLNFGGPYLGFFTTKKEFIRKVSGRIVGETIDEDGKRGYVLTLTAREQHIRRERATSNICTNQGLNALAIAIYLSLLGKSGIKEVAHQCYQKAHYLAKKINQLDNYKTANEAPFFNEFVVECPIESKKLIKILLDYGILAGLDLSEIYPDDKNKLLVAVTEKFVKSDMDFFIQSLKEVGNA